MEPCFERNLTESRFARKITLHDFSVVNFKRACKFAAVEVAKSMNLPDQSVCFPLKFFPSAPQYFKINPSIFSNFLYFSAFLAARDND